MKHITPQEMIDLLEQDTIDGPIAAHVRECPSCSKLYEDFKAMISGLKDTGQETGDFTEVAARIREAEQPKDTLQDLLSCFKPLLNKQELSRLLDVSGDELDSIAAALPSLVLGGEIRFLRSTVLDWLKTQEQPVGGSDLARVVPFERLLAEC